MLTREQVVALAQRHGLGEHGERLVDRVRPGWRLDPQPGRTARPAESRIGGQPDLAPTESWPLNARGIAMTFLAQVDCSTLPPFGGWEDPRPWRHDGRLVRIFADLLDNPNEPGLAVGLACDPKAALSRTEAPPIPEPFPPGGEWDDLHPDDRFHVLPEAAIRLVPFLTAPETDRELKPEIDDFSDPAEAFTAWGSELRGGGSSGGSPAPWELHHLLGEPVSVQDDVLLTGPAVHSADAGMPVTPDPALGDMAAWRVLLSLHMDERIDLDIHDGGAFTVLAPVADLAEGRYDRLVCSVDSG